MVEKGANTFPFHNLPPELKILKGISCSFHPFLYWIKEKSMVNLSIRNICDKMQNTQVSSPTVLQNWRLSWGYKLKMGLP